MNSSNRDIAIILGAIVTFGLPVAFTLATVVGAANAPDPSPRGYTYSLSLFIVPVAALGVWHMLHRSHDHDHRALIIAGGAIAVLGATLDVMFGYHFLCFPDRGATLGVRLPAWSWSQFAFVPQYLPIEEFAFYIFGGFFVIGAYLWLDRNWLQDYHTDDYSKAAKAELRLVRFSPTSAAALIILLCAGIVYKHYGPHEYNAGLPGYYIFLLVAGFIPTIIFLPAVRRFVNWRAFAISYLLLLLISLVWEATLGVPYGWWGYNQEQMLGVLIRPWSGLPIEAVLLWLIISWAAVLLYELLRIYFHMNRSPKAALFGHK